MAGHLVNRADDRGFRQTCRQWGPTIIGGRSPGLTGGPDDAVAAQKYSGGVRTRHNERMRSAVRILPLAVLLVVAAGCGSAPHPSDLRQPLVIAHRGASTEAPENTLVAYRRAIEMGADMAECDVWLTKDRVPVLLHDGTLERTAGVTGHIEDLTFEQAARLDVGAWKAPRYSGERIPTLRETLDLVRGHLTLIVEIKPQGMEREVVDVIRASAIPAEQVMVFSFHHEVIAEIGRLAPELPRTWLISKLPTDEEGRRERLRAALEVGSSAIGLSKSAVDPRIVKLAHLAGLQVFSWTINDRPTMRRVSRAGVDGIISDAPDVVVDEFSRRP